MNYRVRLLYIVDRFFDAAVLIVGVGRQQDGVTIRRKAEGYDRAAGGSRAP